MRPGTPKYRQLAALIQDAILDGTYPEGARVPSEEDLAAVNGYSRITVRTAYQLLKDAGWLVTSKGLGTYVNLAGKRINDPANSPRSALSQFLPSANSLGATDAGRRLLGGGLLPTNNGMSVSTAEAKRPLN